MKKIFFFFLLMLSGALLNAQNSLEILLLKAKPDIEEAAKNYLEINCNIPGYETFSFYQVAKHKNAFKITTPYYGHAGWIDYGKNYLEKKWYGEGPVLNSQFSVCLDSYDTAGQEQMRLFQHDESGSGGYFRPDDKGPLLFLDYRYSLLTTEQIASFEKELLEIITATQAAVRQNREIRTAQLGFYSWNKKIRLVKKPYYGGGWETKIFFLEKYEADSLLKKLSQRPADTILIQEKLFDTRFSYQWYLDEDRHYVITQNFIQNLRGEEYSRLAITCQLGNQTYYLHLDQDFRIWGFYKFVKKIPEGNLVKPVLGRYDYTRQISPNRWFNLGVPMDLLNTIKTELLTHVRVL